MITVKVLEKFSLKFLRCTQYVLCTVAPLKLKISTKHNV